MAQTDIYTAKMGQPPMPDEGPTKPMSRKRKPKLPDSDIYTADKGQPPMPNEGPTTPAMPKKGKPMFAKGGVKVTVTGVVTSTSTITVSSAVTGTSGSSVAFVGFPEVIVGWNFGFHSYLIAAGV